jgi:hypothetical protein
MVGSNLMSDARGGAEIICGCAMGNTRGRGQALLIRRIASHSHGQSEEA